MSKVTKKLIKIVETRASEQNSWTEAQELLQQGADITVPTNNGPMIHSVIAEEKRCRPVMPWRADNCQHLIQVLQNGASDRLSAQVFTNSGGDIKEMYTLIQLQARCYQSTKYGPLGLLGSLLQQDKVPIRLDIVQFLIENDPHTKYSLTTVDDQKQTCLSLAKNNLKCSQNVIDYMQQQFDDILNQISFVQPQIDPNEVITWIRRGANTEAIDQNGNTILSNAVITGNLKLVRALVSAGSDTTHRNADGLTPLQIAKKATLKNPHLIAVLEAQHMNAEFKRLIETKKSQLTTEEVRTLLENGADINATLANNDSFLHLLIASEGTPEMMATFVNEFNADLSAINTNGYRPIESCILLDEDPFVYLVALLKLQKMTTDLLINSRLNQTLVQFAIDAQRFRAAKIIQDELNLRLWNCMIHGTNTNEDNYESMMIEMKKLVTCGAQIDYKHCDNEFREQTVLHLACEKGAEELIQYMIKDLKADYMLQNYDGNYPLSIAAEFGHLSTVEYLRGLPNSTLNLYNKERQTPLHLATKKRHLLVVQYLVMWGVDHQAQNLLKQTPLDIARANVPKNKEEEINDKKLIRFLEQLICPPIDDSVQQSANATPPNPDLDTCELVLPVVVNPICMSNDDAEATLGKQRKGLFSGSPNDSLHEAVRNGSVWEAQRAISQGADIRHRKKNHTPYDVALLAEKEYSLYLQSSTPVFTDRLTLEDMLAGCRKITYMIQQIAQTKLIEAIDQSNASLVMSYHVAGAPLIPELLYKACNASDNVEIVDYLLNQSVDIYQALMNDSSSDSPYRIVKKKNFSKLTHYLKYRLSLECTKAVKENNLEMVKKLVYAGANVEMHNTNNLNEALEHQNADLAHFLCENGAKMPPDWLTAETIVLESTLSQQLKSEIVFRINQCLINRRLRLAAASGDLNSVIRCQRLGADINSTNCHGSSALLYAIQYGNCFPIVHALVSSGASILHSNDDEPISLIDLAKKKGYKQIVDYLSKELNTQFLSAILNNQRKTAEKLGQLGADFNYQDEQKRTALHYAVQYHGVDLVNWLCECGSTPTICDINGDYPIIQATGKGDYAMVEFFVTKYPVSKKQTNKAGLTALEIAQTLKYGRIAELIETGKGEPSFSNDREEIIDEPKHDYETLMQASRNGHIKIIQEFIDQRYDSKENKRRLCYDLIQVAKQAKQCQIVDILEPYYKTKLNIELASDMELGGNVTLNEYHRKILRGFLSGLSNIIADSTIVLDPTDPKTYVDLFSALASSIAKRSHELEEITSEQDVKKLIEQDQLNTREQLIKISEQLAQLLESRDSLQARIEDADERLFKQQHLTAMQRKEFIKEKENHQQQLAVYECSIFLFQRQQEATLIRQKTIDFIKANPNLIVFYRTVENRLEALFHSVLAAQGGYLKRETVAKFGIASAACKFWPTKIPILNLTSAGIKAVLDPILSKLNEKEQQKEWHNISTLGNIEELRRIASDTAGLVTLYYREQLQSIDSSKKINSNKIANVTTDSVKHVHDVYPKSFEEMPVAIVAEYITTWIINELKLGTEKINPNEPLPQQLWLCVARKDPINQRKTTKLTDTVTTATGQEKVCLKMKNFFGEEIISSVQIRYLIGCVSVVSNDGSIYQYSVPKNFSDNGLNDLELFGYVYVTPFSSSEKTLQSIVEGRKLNLAKRDEQGNILTRFEDIIEHAQTYTIQNDQYSSKSLIVKETAHQVAEILREQKIFVDSNDVKEELRKARETIELSVDVLREEIQEKTKFYQISIDATHEQMKQESEENRKTMKIDNELRYEQASNKLNETLTIIEKRLEQQIANRMNDIEHNIEEKTRQILKMAETAKVQSLQAVEEAKQVTQLSQQLLKEAKEAVTSVQYLVQWTEHQRQEFQLEIKSCQAAVTTNMIAQKEFCERMIAEMRTKIEHDLERMKEPTQTSPDAMTNTLDIQRTTKTQLGLYKKENKRTTAEGKNARQQTGRSVVEVRETEEQIKRAAIASAAALAKVNSINEKVEKVLEQIGKLTKNQESSSTTPVFETKNESID